MRKRSNDVAHSSGDGEIPYLETSTTQSTSSESNSIFQLRENPQDDPPDVNVAQLNVDVTVGDFLRFDIPNNTFYDKEDGGMRRLRMRVVEMRNGGNVVVEDTWLKVNGEELVLYGLPPKQAKDKVCECIFIFKR